MWQIAKKSLEVFIVAAVCVLVIALVVFIILTYLYNWNVPGLRGKNLWDWLQLLIIPAVLAMGGYLFTYTTSRNEQKAAQLRDQTERDITTDNQREAALQAYIDSMSELLLHEKLRESQPEDEVRTIGRVRTLTVLPRLDKKRKASVLQFLHESRIIDKDRHVIDLRGADLSEADLGGANLGGATLRGANLRGAYLGGAYLSEADLGGAFLGGADLRRANLRGADLGGATLGGANLRGADLRGADLRGDNLRGADLREANLSEANLRGAILREANLRGADLGGADLGGAYLGGAILSSAQVTEEQLKQAGSLEGAIMPDGTKHA